jgi:hypothetical protein
MTTQARQRPPEELAPEIWFYSLERRAQTALLRRVTLAMAVTAGVAVIGAVTLPSSAAIAAGAVAAVIVIQAAALARARRQKTSILAQLQRGDNPQTIDTVGTSIPNRSVLLVALAAAVAVWVAGLLIIGALA